MRAGLSCLVIWRQSHRGPSPRRADGGVGSRGARGPLSLILSCTCKICAMYEMLWHKSMSFNSPCTPSSSTQASCVRVMSPGPDSRDHNNRRTNRDAGCHQSTGRAQCCCNTRCVSQTAPGKHDVTATCSQLSRTWPMH